MTRWQEEDRVMRQPWLPAQRLSAIGRIAHGRAVGLYDWGQLIHRLFALGGSDCQARLIDAGRNKVVSSCSPPVPVAIRRAGSDAPNLGRTLQVSRPFAAHRIFPILPEIQSLV